MNRHIAKTAAAFLAGAVAIYLIAGFLLVPSLVRQELIAYVERDLGHRLTIRRVAFNPFTFSASIHDLDLRDPGGGPLLSFKRLDVDFELRSALDRAWTFSAISMQRPAIYAELRRDGTLNFTQLIEALSQSDTPDTPMPRVRVGRIALNEGEIEFADLKSGKRARLELVPVALELRELSTLPSEHGPYTLTARTTDGETLQWSGQGGLNPLRASGKLALSGWKAATVAGFLGRYLHVAAPSGQINFSASYRLGYDRSALTGQIDGIQLTVDDLAVFTPGGKQPLLALASLRMDDGKVDFGEARMTFPHIFLDQLKVSLHDDGGPSGWRSATAPLKPSAAAIAGAAPTPSPPSMPPASAPPAVDAASTTRSAAWRIDLPKIEVSQSALAISERNATVTNEVAVDQLGLLVAAHAELGTDAIEIALRDLNLTMDGVGFKQGDDDLRFKRLTLGIPSVSSTVAAAIKANLSEIDLQISALDGKLAEAKTTLESAGATIKSVLLSSATGRAPQVDASALRLTLAGGRVRHADDSLRVARIELQAGRVATDEMSGSAEVLADVARSRLASTMSQVELKVSDIGAVLAGSEATLKSLGANASTINLTHADGTASTARQAGGSIQGLRVALNEFGLQRGEDKIRLQKVVLASTRAAAGLGSQSAAERSGSSAGFQTTLADLSVQVSKIEGKRTGSDAANVSLASAVAGIKTVSVKSAEAGSLGTDLALDGIKLVLDAVNARQGTDALRLRTTTVNLGRLSTQSAGTARTGLEPTPNAIALTALRVQTTGATARRGAAKADTVEIAGASLSTASAALALDGGLKDLSADGAALQITKFVLRNPTSGAELARLARAEASGASLRLAERRVSVERAALLDVAGQAIIDPRGKLDWNSLIATLIPPSTGTPTPKASGGKPWQMTLKSAQVTNLSASFTDQRRAPALALGLDGVNLRAANIQTHGDVSGQVELTASVRSGGRIHATGQFNAGSLATDLKVTLSELSLKPAQTFLAEFANLELTSANASATGRFRYGMPKSAGAELLYEGSLALSKVLIEETAPREPLISAEELSAPKVRLTLGPDRVEIAELLATGFSTKLLIAEDQTVNLGRVLKPRPASPKPSAAAASPFPVSIARIRMKQGRLEFSDLSLRPQFAVKVHELGGSITGVSNQPAARSRLELEGRVDEFGFARIRGDLNLLAPKEYTDVTMTFRNLEMTALTPYSAKFAGYRIASGKLSLNLKYALKGKRLMGHNQIVLDKLVLGEKVASPSARDLPIELAIALLKDDKGRIDIGLPVEGSLDDPKFNIGALVGKAIGNLIGNIVTAPFKMLASIFGGGSEQLERIEFDPGSARLLPPERQKLRTVAAALAKRPQLALRVAPGIAAAEDATAMRLLGLRRDVFASMGTKLEPGEDPGPVDFANPQAGRAIEAVYAERIGLSALQDRRAAFAQLAVAEADVPATPGGQPGANIAPGPAPVRMSIMYRNLYEQMLAESSVSDSALAELGRKRGEAVSAELVGVGGVAAPRVSTAAPAPANGASASAIPTTLELVVGK